MAEDVPPDLFGDLGSPLKPELPSCEMEGLDLRPGIVIPGRGTISTERDDPDFPRPSIEPYSPLTDQQVEAGGRDESLGSLFSDVSEPQSSSTVKPDEDQRSIVVPEKQVKTAGKPGKGQTITRRKRKTAPPPPYKDSNLLWVTLKSSQMFRPPAPKWQPVPLPAGQPHITWSALPTNTGACGLCGIRALFKAIHQRCCNCGVVICRNCIEEGRMIMFPGHPNIDVSQFHWGNMKPSCRRPWLEKLERDRAELAAAKAAEELAADPSRKELKDQRYTQEGYPYYGDGSRSTTPSSVYPDSAPSTSYPPSVASRDSRSPDPRLPSDNEDGDYDEDMDSGNNSSDDDYRPSAVGEKRKRSDTDVPAQEPRPFIFERPSPIPIGLANSRPVRTSSIDTYEKMRGTTNTGRGGSRQQPAASSGGPAQMGGSPQKNDSSFTYDDEDYESSIDIDDSPRKGYQPPQHVEQPITTSYTITIDDNGGGNNRSEPGDFDMLRFNLVASTFAKHVQGLHKKDMEDIARARRNKKAMKKVVTLETHLVNVVATFWQSHAAAQAARDLNEVDAVRLLRAHVDIAVRKLEISDSTLILSWVDYIEKRVQAKYDGFIPHMMRIMNPMIV